jgi:hypothetical protein
MASALHICGQGCGGMLLIGNATRRKHADFLQPSRRRPYRAFRHSLSSTLNRSPAKFA